MTPRKAAKTFRVTAVVIAMRTLSEKICTPINENHPCANSSIAHPYRDFLATLYAFSANISRSLRYDFASSTLCGVTLSPRVAFSDDGGSSYALEIGAAPNEVPLGMEILSNSVINECVEPYPYE